MDCHDLNEPIEVIVLKLEAIVLHRRLLVKNKTIGKPLYCNFIG